MPDQPIGNSAANPVRHGDVVGASSAFVHSASGVLGAITGPVHGLGELSGTTGDRAGPATTGPSNSLGAVTGSLPGSITTPRYGPLSDVLPGSITTPRYGLLPDVVIPGSATTHRYRPLPGVLLNSDTTHRYDLGAVTSSGRDLGSGGSPVAAPRSIPVSVYVADEGIHEQVQTAVEQWLGTANVSIEAWE